MQDIYIFFQFQFPIFFSFLFLENMTKLTKHHLILRRNMHIRHWYKFKLINFIWKSAPFQLPLPNMHTWNISIHIHTHTYKKTNYLGFVLCCHLNVTPTIFTFSQWQAHLFTRAFLCTALDEWLTAGISSLQVMLLEVVTVWFLVFYFDLHIIQ